MAPTETLRPAPRPSYLMYGPLKAYGFERDSLSFMASYRSDTEQQVCIKNSFIYWQKLITGVSLGSTLQPFYLKFLSLIFLFFVSSSCLSNCADDSTFYSSGVNLEEVKNILRADFDAVTRWF